MCQPERCWVGPSRGREIHQLRYSYATCGVRMSIIGKSTSVSLARQRSVYWLAQPGLTARQRAAECFSIFRLHAMIQSPPLPCPALGGRAYSTFTLPLLVLSWQRSMHPPPPTPPGEPLLPGERASLAADASGVMRYTTMYAFCVVLGMMVLLRLSGSESSMLPPGAQMASLPSNPIGSCT